ncbi:DUF2530 domain-containing protein [Streptomonospora wellingtoniae]|uniref:DUF2530 domain-containing protein n=1 Tax=Streptomonospora wellingtoniae TaxID=3075544 RepID=A0ABU2KXZ5_9ACTN|nr:DUF2530 domain-containing protein [Streptomonospora sp. DSM 45055]MDT0304174.1 DUF2530 domain-containing protein [Streptomonospora sp. DSM 45055]
MRHPRKPDPEVLESDYRVPTALGTAAWAAALIALLVMGDGLAEQDRWWRWVCLTGIVFGLFGYAYIPRHLRKHAESSRRRAAEADGVVPGQGAPAEGCGSAERAARDGGAAAPGAPAADPADEPHDGARGGG